MYKAVNFSFSNISGSHFKIYLDSRESINIRLKRSKYYVLLRFNFEACFERRKSGEMESFPMLKEEKAGLYLHLVSSK